MGLHHIQVTQRGKTGFVARSKATNAIQVIKREDWDYRRDYCDKHFDHTFGVEEGSKLILAAEEQFKGYTEFKLELVPASLPAIPYPELQAEYAKQTGGNSVAEVQWLCYYKGEGYTDEGAIRATRERFKPLPPYVTAHNDQDLTGRRFPVDGNPPYEWTVESYYRGGSWRCRESQHQTTCCFYDVDILAATKPKPFVRAKPTLGKI